MHPLSSTLGFLTGRLELATKDAGVFIGFQLILFLTCASIGAKRIDAIVITNNAFSTLVNIFTQSGCFIHSIARSTDTTLVKITSTILVRSGTGIIRWTRSIGQGRPRKTYSDETEEIPTSLLSLSFFLHEYSSSSSLLNVGSQSRLISHSMFFGRHLSVRPQR